MPVFSSNNYLDRIKRSVKEEHTQLFRRANLRYLQQTEQASLKQFNNLSLAKTRVSDSRHKVLEELDRYLIQFEKHFIANGGEVFWANSAGEACEKVRLLCENEENQEVVFTKGRLFHELNIFSYLKRKGIKLLPGDTESYLCELTEEKYLHHNRVAMDFSSESIYEKLKDAFFPEEKVIGVETLARALRDKLSSYSDHHVLLSEADFIIAKNGALCFLADNFDYQIFSGVKKHIVLVGIDKVVTALNDLDLLLPLKASSSGIGTMFPTINLITSPKKKGELEGPEELIVILVNNGRTNILKNKRIRKIATCIHCASCQNHSPLYAVAGTAPYPLPYTSPYGLITAHAFNMHHKLPDSLNYALTLSGECKHTCPVKINLQEMCFSNRKDAVEKEQIKPELKRFMRWYKFMTSSNKRMNNKNLRSIWNFLIKQYMGKYWGYQREIPRLAPKSFTRLYAEKYHKE
ncbi:MAG: hypothetical protein CSA04_02460 [Bacteroidetes bacterium]|nr:MAG: hypothetical protein CSA04_02460 [Bacteroidota bacterium]